MQYMQMFLMLATLLYLSSCGKTPASVQTETITRIQTVPSPVPVATATYTLTSHQDGLNHIVAGATTAGHEVNLKWPSFVQADSSQGEHTAELYIDVYECRYFAPDGVNVLVPVDCTAGQVVTGSTLTFYAQWSSTAQPFSVSVAVEAQ